jgi:galactokinase
VTEAYGAAVNPVAAAGDGFVAAYGRSPDGVWAAPGRVNLIGEHTDYNDGYVLPFALPLRTAVAAAPLVDREWRVTTDVTGGRVTLHPEDLEPGRVTGWAGYVAGVLWAMTEAGHQPRGCALYLSSDVPLGAGLSSSASMECAVLSALAELSDRDIGGLDAARLAQRAENDYVGMPCGLMDQAAAMLCAEGHALFLDNRTLGARQVPLDLDGAGLVVLVVDTRAPHALVDGEYAERRESCARAAALLGVPALRDVCLEDLPDAERRVGAAERGDVLRKRLRHVVTENDRVLRAVALLDGTSDGKADPRALAGLLTASHASLADDYEVSVPRLDAAVAAAIGAGAHGARMTGAGFGGCALALCEAGGVADVEAAVTDAYAARGWDPPVTFTASPSRGAHRAR